MVLNEALVLLGTGAARSIGGWLENAFDDGKVSAFEWRQLGATVLKFGLLGAGIFLGFNQFGVDVWSAAGITFAGDWVVKKLSPA